MEGMKKVAVLLLVMGLSLIVTGLILVRKNQDYDQRLAAYVTREVEGELEQENEILTGMTLPEKIRQMVVVRAGLDEFEYSGLGGVILMEYGEQERDLIESLGRDEMGPLIMVDQEGGSVVRIGEQWVGDVRAMVEIGSQDQAFEWGRARGRELKRLGIDINLAPVAEHIENKQSFLYARTFQANDVETTANLAVAMMKGYEAGGLVPMVKHFPGHYGNAGDPHVGLSVVNMNKDELIGRLGPFIRAISEGAGVIMTSHTNYPLIDSEWPASLSEVLIQEILREELGFEGVVISDDLGMEAIANKYSVGEAAVRAVMAGSDLVLVVSGEESLEIYEALLKAVLSGVISEKRIDASVGRVLRVKDIN